MSIRKKRILTEHEARRFRMLIATIREHEREFFPFVDRSEFRARVESNHNILIRIEDELEATIAHHERERGRFGDFTKRARR